MKRVLVGLVSLIFLLSGCAGEKNRNTNTEQEIAHEQSVPRDTVEQPEIIVEVPKYVCLPIDEKPTDSMVFRTLTQSENEPEEIVAQYQDLTDIENAIALESVYGDVGESITLPLSVCGRVNLCAFDLRVSYDPVKLQYQGAENMDDDLIVNCDEESGKLLINFLSAKNLSGKLNCCDLQFKVKDTAACDSVLQVDVIEAVALGTDDEIVFCHFSTVDGIAHLNQEGR